MQSHESVRHMETAKSGETYIRREEACKIKKIIGTPARCPWDTQLDKQGSTGQKFPVLLLSKN